MTFWEAVLCLCRKDNQTVHPVSNTHESVPIPNNHIHVTEQPVASVDIPVQNGEIPRTSEVVETKEADVVPQRAPNNIIESHPELHAVETPDESKVAEPALDAPLAEEEADEEVAILSKRIEEHQANEEGAKIPEDLQPEVKRLSIDVTGVAQTIDPVVEALEKAAWMVQSLPQSEIKKATQPDELDEINPLPKTEIDGDQDLDEQQDIQEDHQSATEEEEGHVSERQKSEAEEKFSLETINETNEIVLKEEGKVPKLNLHGTGKKWEPNDSTTSSTSQKVIKVKASAVRESKSKKPVLMKSMDLGRTKNIVHFQGGRRSSVPMKKETRKKKTDASDDSPGEVVLVSPTEAQIFNALVEPGQQAPMILLMKKNGPHEAQTPTKQRRASNQSKSSSKSSSSRDH